MSFNFGVFVSIVFLTFFLVGAAQFIYRGHVLPGALFALGALGFVTPPAILPAAGNLLDGVELPAYFHTTTILGPNGKRFALTSHLSRVQRYDRAGRFERGWFVNSGGGLVEIRLTTDGKIAVASWRPRQVELFNADGSSAGSPRRFSMETTKAMCPANTILCLYLVAGMTVQNPTPADNPSLRWNTVLLFPLWSPVIAWLLLACGGVIPALRERLRQK